MQPLSRLLHGSVGALALQTSTLAASAGPIPYLPKQLAGIILVVQEVESDVPFPSSQNMTPSSVGSQLMRCSMHATQGLFRRVMRGEVVSSSGREGTEMTSSEGEQQDSAIWEAFTGGSSILGTMLSLSCGDMSTE